MLWGKAYSPRLHAALTVTAFRSSQLLKANFPMLDIFAGMLTDSRDSQLAKAFSPMVCRLSGSVMEGRYLHS